MKAMRILRSLWLVAVVCAVSVWAQPDWAAASQRAVLKADWAAVAEVAQQWKQHDPNATIADWLLGYAGLATGNYNQALAGFSRLDDAAKTRAVLDYALGLVNQDSKNAVAQMLKGDALARTGDYAEAFAALDEAVRLDTRSALFHDVRGVVRVLAGKADAAIEDFNEAIQMAPDFADAYASRGLARGYEGRIEDALSDFGRALELAPDYVVARNARAVIFASAGRLEEAKNDLLVAAQSGVGFYAIAANLSTIEWLDARGRFKAEVADQRSGVLRMEALSVYSGVNTENGWQSFANAAVDILRQKTGRDAVVVPFRATDGQSYREIRDMAYNAFLDAARQGKNIVPVVVPHLTLSGYVGANLGISSRDDLLRDLEFGKAATLAIHAGFLRAQKELAGAGQRVVLEHGALAHSLGTIVVTGATENFHQQLGQRPFDSLWLVAPRVKQDRIAGLNKLGYSPDQINVLAIKGDAWAVPYGPAANISTAKRGAENNHFTLYIVQSQVARGLPWETQTAQHNLLIANPRLNVEVESYAPGQQRRMSTDFIGLVAGQQKLPAYWTPGTASVAEARNLVGLVGRDLAEKALVVGDKQDPRVAAMLSSLPATKGIQVPMADLASLQRQAKEYGATRIIGILPQQRSSLDSTQEQRLTPKLDQTFKPLYLPPNNPTAVPALNYRLPSTGLPGDNRGGVKMKADVVINQPADLSEFGGGTSEKATVAAQQQGLLSPFLLFCAMLTAGK